MTTTNTDGLLLERATELDALRDAIAHVGSGPVVLLEGAAGIGKSSLLAVAAALAQDAGLMVLRARGSQLERDFAFGVARQLFEPPLRAMSDTHRSGLLTGAAALAAPVLSERADLHGIQPSPEAGFAALHGLYWLCVGLAERKPLLIAVDDLHWSDAASIRYLAQLAARLADLPIVLLCATRRGEEAADSIAFAELLSLPAAAILTPRPLSETAIAVLVARRLEGADPAFCRACYEAVAGNPFLLGQLLTELHRDGIAPDRDEAWRVQAVGPRSVSRAMLARLAALPHGAAKLAAAAAILGNGAALRHAAVLAGMEMSDAVKAADGLARAELFTREERLEFVHPILRQAVYEDIGARERALRHRQAAGLLAAETPAPERVAVHLLAADPECDAWVVARLCAASDASLARGDPGNACRYLLRALEEPPGDDARIDVLRRLGIAELLNADHLGLEHLQQARELTVDPVKRAGIALHLSRALTPIGDFRRARLLLEQSLTETAGIDAELTLMLQAELASQLSNIPGGYTQAADFETSFVELTGDTPAQRLALTCLAVARLRARRSRDDVECAASRALADGRLLTDQGPASPAMAYVLTILAAIDRFDAAAPEAEAMLTLSRDSGSVVGTAMARALLSRIAFGRGDVRQAEEHGRQAVDASADSGFILAVALAWLIDAHVERGDLDAAFRELERCGYEAEVAQVVTSTWLLESRGRLHAARGDQQRALEDLLAAGHLADLTGIDNPAMCAWRSQAALAQLRLENRDAARLLAGDELQLAQAIGAPRAIGRALRIRGLCQPAASGIEDLRSAVTILEATEARLEHARALVDLGAMLRRDNSRAQAREPLIAGHQLALRCGATTLAEHARHELKATGARPRRHLVAGADSLTASERRICHMAVDDMTNREIAQALFVTLRTVESHLTAAYRKLDVSSRGELRSALAEPT